MYAYWKGIGVDHVVLDRLSRTTWVDTLQRQQPAATDAAINTSTAVPRLTAGLLEQSCPSFAVTRVQTRDAVITKTAGGCKRPTLLVSQVSSHLTGQQTVSEVTDVDADQSKLETDMQLAADMELKRLAGIEVREKFIENRDQISSK